MSNNIECGFLDNIVYDYANGHLPIDDLNKDLTLFDGLTWSEQSQIRKWYNKALKDGLHSVSHLKLAYVVADIIKKYNPNTHFFNKVGKGAYNKDYYDKFYR